MPSKPIELPPKVAKTFVKHMLRVFQFVQSARVARTKCGEIATRQLHALRLKRRSIRPGKVDQAVALRVAKIFARAEQMR